MIETFINANSVEMQITSSRDSSLQRQRLSDVVHQEAIKIRENKRLKSHERMKCWCNYNINKMGVTPGADVMSRLIHDRSAILMASLELCMI